MSTPSSATSPQHEQAEKPALPAYVHVRPNGIYIALSPPPAQDILRTFVDRLFNSGAYFKGLDYACFMDLLYGAKPVIAKDERMPEVLLAREIVSLAPQRKDLYRAIKLIRAGEEAEYMFEPLFTEITVEESVYGPPGEDGIAPVVEVIQRIEQQPTKLDFDEFIADAWCKGVRFGIDADTVRATIQSGTPTRITIARQREPTASKDAQLTEENNKLHQDRSPLILASGRAILSTAKNHFPQVAKDAPLLRKIPRALGDPGYRVTGAVIEPHMPKDLDLQPLSGIGTRIEHTAKGEVIVADMDGFLSFDDRTKKISITATIENRSGISARSTGDIKLGVDEFVEHGEVQEGRIVEGKHLTFRSAVYGNVLSTGGDIHLDDNLSGGHAESIGGNITVSGRTYNAVLEAWDGNIEIKFAENSIISGKSVSIERAVNCEIIAETLQLGQAEGCAIAGKNVWLNSAQTRKDRETVITILIPDRSSLEDQMNTNRKEIAKINLLLQRDASAMSAAQANPKQAKLIDLDSKIRAGTVQLNAQQQKEWQQVYAQLPPEIQNALALLEERKILQQEFTSLAQQIKALYTEQRCSIKEVLGETVAQTLSSHMEISAFRNLPKQELKTELLHIGSPKKVIFKGAHGSFEWSSKAPELPDTGD